MGRYDLHEVIGTGGFATVYRATDPSLEATVAIKVLADNWSHDPDIRRRFRQEAVLLRRVQAEGRVPGIVEVYDIDETAEGRPFFVMRWADRGTLKDRAGSRAWTPVDVIPVVETLNATLEALHAAGVVHRDLKPSNLLMHSDRGVTRSTGALIHVGERLVVGDLGLAKDLTDDPTALSLAGGTEAFMAPEQRDLTATVDRRADVFAASAVIHRLLSGSDGHNIPAQISSVLMSGMAHRPDDRPGSISEWHDELRAALAATATPPRPVDTPGTGITRSFPARVVASIVVLALLVVGGVAAVLLTADDESSIIGPASVEVGDTAIYRVDASPDTDVSWIDESGRSIDDRSLVVTPLLPGDLTVTALVDGERATLAVEATPSALGPQILGPDRARVGEVTEYTATVRAGSSDVYWLDPAGERVDSPSLRITPDRSGPIVIALVATSPDGVERGAQLVVQVGA